MGVRLPSDWDSRRVRVFERDDYTCQACGQVGGTEGDTKVIVHHKTEGNNGRNHNIKNMITICENCHDKFLHPIVVSTGNDLGLDNLLEYLDFLEKSQEIATEANEFMENSIDILKKCISSAEKLTSEYPDLSDDTKREYKRRKKSLDSEMKNGYNILTKLEEEIVIDDFKKTSQYYKKYVLNSKELYFSMEHVRNGLEIGISVSDETEVTIDELSLLKKDYSSDDVFSDSGGIIVESIRELDRTSSKLESSMSTDFRKIKNMINWDYFELV